MAKTKNPRTRFEIKSISGQDLSSGFQWCVSNLPLTEGRSLIFNGSEITIITASDDIIDKVNKHFGTEFRFGKNWLDNKSVYYIP